MTDLVLFLCHANVCRSRLMEHEFRAAEDATRALRWRSASAGVSAAAGHPLCDEVRAFTDASPSGARDEDADGGAVQLERGLLLDAGLVITATRAERAEVALLVPTLRTRTFTLREAVALAQTEPRSVSSGRSQDPADILTAFAGSLDRRRGSVSAGNKTSGSRWPHRRHHLDDVDITDAHHRRPRDHQRVLRAVQSETVALHRELVAFAGRVSGVGSRKGRSAS